MKLGEALTLRAKQAQKLNDLQGRIKAAAMLQEGDTPQEDCEALLASYLVISEEHGALNTRIARANNTTAVGLDKSLAALIQEREVLTRKRNILRLACSAASPASERFRYMRGEVKFVPQVDVTKLRKQEEMVEGLIFDLNARIQAINWETELT